MSKPDTQRVTNSWGTSRSMRATVECLTCGKSQTVDQEDGGFAIDQWPCECGDSECKRRVCRNCPECDSCGLHIAPECSVEYSGKVLCRECMAGELADAAACAAEIICPDSPDENHHAAPIGSEEDFTNDCRECYYCGEKATEYAH